MDKHQLSERDICTKFITPAIQQAGWEQHQFREEVNLTDGRVMVRGKLASLLFCFKVRLRLFSLALLGNILVNLRYFPSIFAINTLIRRAYGKPPIDRIIRNKLPKINASTNCPEI